MCDGVDMRCVVYNVSCEMCHGVVCVFRWSAFDRLSVSWS